MRPQPNISTLNLAFFFSGKSTGDENKNMISDFVIFTKLNLVLTFIKSEKQNHAEDIIGFLWPNWLLFDDTGEKNKMYKS